MIHEVVPGWFTLKNAFDLMIRTCASPVQKALARSAFKCMEKKETEGVLSVCPTY